MNLDTLEPVDIGGITQWIRIRGTAASNPPLLLMQQGPGLPIINEAHDYERRLGLEREFTVVYWDQRGTGLSSRTSELRTDHMVDDTVSMLELLCERFDRKSFVAGFSFGATFAAQAAVRRPELVAALIATGMDIDVPFAENHTYDFVLGTARRQGNRRAIRQLEKLGAPPHVEAKQFVTRARWAMNFGGVTANATFNTLTRDLLGSLRRSPDYSVADAVRTVRASQAALLSQLATTDLTHTMPALDVPIVIAQGRLDQVAPPEAAQRFYDSLIAPSKELVWFENSAHTPQYDEPAKFRDTLMTVRASQPAGS
jgi:pimeloyl-ACP methyl ester carboxylesterase